MLQKPPKLKNKQKAVKLIWTTIHLCYKMDLHASKCKRKQTFAQLKVGFSAHFGHTYTKKKKLDTYVHTYIQIRGLNKQEDLT